VLDIGGHHGFYTCCAAVEYPKARFTTIEPSAEALRLLGRNVELNHIEARIRVLPVGLGAASGEGRLIHSGSGSWGNSLFEDETPGAQVEAVKVESLAAILDGDRPDIIKCNAEGAEFTLVDQLEPTGVRPLLLILMVHPEFGSMASVHEAAARLGYRMVVLGTDDRPALHLWRDDLELAPEELVA
jgi:FkbM family methyltransferase